MFNDLLLKTIEQMSGNADSSDSTSNKNDFESSLAESYGLNTIFTRGTSLDF